jgi:uncharacterized protein (TIGR00725 family)
MGREIGVMGSARLAEGDAWWEYAYQLGELLARQGCIVVTGGYGGLMSAVSRGAHSAGGRVVGLPMQHWSTITPNAWNADLRWSSDYGTRFNHILRCEALIALPGGVGTLSEIALVWAANQTEGRPLPLILLGDCWPPIVEAIREHLVVDEKDISLLRFATSPQEAVQVLQVELRKNTWMGQGPRG